VPVPYTIIPVIMIQVPVSVGTTGCRSGLTSIRIRIQHFSAWTGSTKSLNPDLIPNYDKTLNDKFSLKFHSFSFLSFPLDLARNSESAPKESLNPALIQIRIHTPAGTYRHWWASLPGTRYCKGDKNKPLSYFLGLKR
jgi:hypothetical protein